MCSCLKCSRNSSGSLDETQAQFALSAPDNLGVPRGAFPLVEEAKTRRERKVGEDPHPGAGRGDIVERAFDQKPVAGVEKLAGAQTRAMPDRSSVFASPRGSVGCGICGQGENPRIGYLGGDQLKRALIKGR